ncbi:MAG: hypothetical protein PWQ43_663 [Rikenellaceae bacterium]|jgi:D-serine deaminase-like pyridoxal phosphate-dependent protein|nr:hypothetical protein [Rikenellaceae bacterium]
MKSLNMKEQHFLYPYTPKLIIDNKKVKKNISNIINKATGWDVRLRPHYKTHQSEVVSYIFEQAGISTITTSSIDMTYRYINDIINDIFMAIPINIYSLDRLDFILNDEYLDRFIVSIDSIEAFRHLVPYLDNRKLFFAIEIDCGYHRSGIDIEQDNKIYEIVAETMQRKLTDKFYGIFSHFGQAYNLVTDEQLYELNYENISKLSKVKRLIESMLDRSIVLSIGDTPSLRIYNKELLNNVDEIRPGNFVFYDAMQYLLGNCSLDEIAAFLYSPIISMHPERSELIIHGGAVHLSKDSVIDDGKVKYGLVGTWDLDKITLIPGAYVKSLSQEHGIVVMDKKYIKNLNIGDHLAIIPVHSCLAMDAMIFKDGVFYWENT